MLISIIKKIINPLLGKTKHQFFFETLNKFSLIGMNIGTGTNFKNSGEEYALKYIKNNLRRTKEPVIFDVGANIGNYSLLLNNNFENKAKIYSFEPSKKTFERLSLNTRKEKNINLYNLGFGDKNEKITLYSNSDESGLASIYKRKLGHFKIEMGQSEEVEIKTIDEFCKNANIKHIDFLKLDVEGNEKKVLDGVKKMIESNSVDFIQFEFGGCNIDSKTYFQNFYYLLKDNYKIYRITKDGLYEIKKYKEEYEIFITTNYLAERK